MTIRPVTPVAAPMSQNVSADDRLYCTPIAQTSWVSYRPQQAESETQAHKAHQPGLLGAAQHHRGLRRTVAVMFHKEPPRIFVHPPTPPPAAIKSAACGAGHSMPRPKSAPPALQAAHVQPLVAMRPAQAAKTV